MEVARPLAGGDAHMWQENVRTSNPFLDGRTQTSLATRTKSLDPFSIMLWARGHSLGDSGSPFSGWTLRALGQAHHGPGLLPGTGHWARRGRK